MEILNLPLDIVKQNPDNPRIISDAKLNWLIDSILSFPKMLELRPVAIDSQNISAGGNQRLKALTTISGFGIDIIEKRLGGVVSFQRKDEKQRKELLKFWKDWLKNPVCPTVSADKLTPAELEEFIAKDNVVVGEWDYAKMEKWDYDQIQDWGVGVELPTFGSDDSNLPDELKGRDLMPDNLEKLHGNDNTLMQRVIICYKPDQAKEVASMLGLDDIEKVLYKYDELK